MNREKFFKGVFLSAFLYNLGTGLVFALLPVFVDGFLPFLGIVNPPSLLFLHLIVLCVWSFAFLYFWAARNLPKAQAISLISGVAKVFFFLVVFAYFILDATTPVSGCNWIAVLVMSIDGIQGVLFLRFYSRFDETFGTASAVM